MLPLPRKPGPTAGLFDQVDYLVAIGAFLGDATLAILKDMGLLVTQGDRLTSAVANVSAELDRVGTEILSEIQDLRDAHGDTEKTEAAIASLTSLAGRVRGLGDQLAADNPAAPTPPAPPPTP